MKGQFNKNSGGYGYNAVYLIFNEERMERRRGEQSFGVSHHGNEGRHPFGGHQGSEPSLQVVSKQMVFWEESPHGE